MEEKILNLKDLRIDGDTQPRVAIDQAVVQEYAEALEAGDEFPPVKVVYDGTTYWLVDGFHRYFAHRRLNRPQIKAEITPGELVDAQWLSLASNKTHGLRRSNQDKVKAVRRALELRLHITDRAVAEHVGVSNTMVSNHRAAMVAAKRATRTEPSVVNGLQLKPAGRSCRGPKRVGRDGKRYSMGRPSQPRSISRHAFQPVRTGTRPPSMTALNMPHDPVMGAKTLIELFGVDYLRALVDFLTKHLQGVKT